MANSRLKRRFTLREIILMIVLVVVLFFGLYFWLVYYPVRDKLAELETQISDLEYDLDPLNPLGDKAKEARYDKMKRELDEVMSRPEEERTEMAEYNNNAQQAKLLGTFNEIFTDIRPEITWPSIPLRKDGSVYIRPIRFSFKISDVDSEHFDSDYYKVKDVLYQLTHTGWRCQMKELTISPDGGQSGGNVAESALTVSCTIEYYEI